MQRLRFIFAHAIFAACCATALCFETVVLLHGTHSLYLYLFIFFATLGSYNFHLIMGAYHATNAGIGHILRQQQRAVALLLLAGLAILLILPQLWHIALYIAAAFVATALYSLVLLPFKFMERLRRLGFAKTLLLALTWTFVTAFLPLQKGIASLQPVEGVFILHRFCLILQLCLLFDLRDTAIDKIKGLHSLATDISPVAAQRLFYSLAMAYLAVSGFLAVMLQQWAMAIAFICVQVAGILLYRVPMERRNYFFYYFLVDGLMLLSVLLTGLLYLLTTVVMQQ